MEDQDQVCPASHYLSVSVFLSLCPSVSLSFSHFVSFRNWFLLTIECQWRTLLAIFFTGYVVSWVLFALIYYIITVIHIKSVSSLLFRLEVPLSTQTSWSYDGGTELWI